MTKIRKYIRDIIEEEHNVFDFEPVMSEKMAEYPNRNVQKTSGNT